jgi:hypothetical protein
MKLIEPLCCVLVCRQGLHVPARVSAFAVNVVLGEDGGAGLIQQDADIFIVEEDFGQNFRANAKS